MANETKLHTIDLKWLNQPQAIAAYVIETPRGLVLLEPGPASTIETLTAELERRGLNPSRIDDIFVTHIHLDHAGAAWHWAQVCHATVHVHRFGAKHLIDPSKLLSSAERIYGDQMQYLWGELRPIPERQVRAIDDGDIISAAGVELSVTETPGHARHHHAFSTILRGERICFTGDAAAMYVPGFLDYVSLPTPPPEFDLELWRESIASIQRQRFDALYPTHFGRVEECEAWLRTVDEAVRDHAAFIQSEIESGSSIKETTDRYRNWLAELAGAAGLDDAAIARHVSQNLVEMNVAGVTRYWEKQQGSR